MLKFRLFLALGVFGLLSGCATSRRDVGRVENNIGPGTTTVRPALDSRNGLAPAGYASQPAIAQVPPTAMQPMLASAQPAGSCCTPTNVMPPLNGMPPAGGYAATPAQPLVQSPQPPYPMQPAAQVPIFNSQPPLAFVGPGTGSSFVSAGGVAVQMGMPQGNPLFGTGQLAPNRGMQSVVTAGFLSENDFAARGLKLHPRMPGEGFSNENQGTSPNPVNSTEPSRPFRPNPEPLREEQRPSKQLTPPAPPEDSRDASPKRSPGRFGEEFQPRSKDEPGPNLRKLPGASEQDRSRPDADGSPGGPFKADSRRDIAIPKSPNPNRGP